MSSDIRKPWLPFNRETVSSLPAHMGVYELADEREVILVIGFAGGRSLFGLRGELTKHFSASGAQLRPTKFRFEITTAYWTRHQELLMVHVAKHGTLPVLNDESALVGLGKLHGQHDELTG